MDEAIDDVPGQPPVSAAVGTMAWWHERERRLGRRRPRTDGLTVERIIVAALRVIDDDGLEALTMRRLADELETASASLYRHVASREELFVVVVDDVIGEVVLPADDLPGRRQVELLAGELRRVLIAHPNLLEALTASPLVGPNARRGAERAVGGLLRAGYPPEVAVHAYLALVDYVLGTVYFDTSRAGRSGPDELPGGHDVVRPSADDVFEFGLLTFLTGLEQRFLRLDT